MNSEGADADITHGRGTFLAECFVDLRDGEVLDVFIFFIIAGHFETSVEEGLFYRSFGVSSIVSHKATFLCGPEPVTLTYIHLILELRIDLRMVDAHTLYSFRQLCGDESARTSRVGKNLPIVGRADERRYALLLLVFIGATSLIVGICHLQDVLQLGRLGIAHSIELVDIDESIFRQFGRGISSTVRIELIGIVPTQFFGKQETTESGFLQALALTDENRHQGIAVNRAGIDPLHHHTQHPAMETMLPARILIDVTSQCCYSVALVPLGKMIDVVRQRMIFFDHRRMEITLNVSIHTMNVGIQSLDSQTIETTLAKRDKVLIFSSFSTNLCTFGEYIEMIVVTSTEKLVQLLHHLFEFVLSIELFCFV